MTKKTVSAFIQNPLNDKYPEKVYRTGDIARLNEKGEFIYINRRDFQIKEWATVSNSEKSKRQPIPSVALYPPLLYMSRKKKKIILIYEGREKMKARSNQPHAKNCRNICIPTR